MVEDEINSERQIWKLIPSRNIGFNLSYLPISTASRAEIPMKKQANPPYPSEQYLDPVMIRKSSPYPTDPTLEALIINRVPPPYPSGLTMGAPGISKIDPPYPTSNFLSSPPYPMPYPETIQPENEDVIESIQRIKSSLSHLDEEASHLFDLPKSAQIEATKNVEFNPLHRSSHPPSSTPSAPSITEFSSSKSEEIILLTLGQIKFELTQEITNEKVKILRETLRVVSERIRLDVSKMTPEGKRMIANELLIVKSAYLEALKKNQERTAPNHGSYRRHSKERNSETLSSLARSEVHIVEVEETKSCRINVPVTLKLLEMIFNTFYLFCIAKLSPYLLYSYTAYCEVVAIIGFCISLVFLWIYLRKIRNEFNRKYLMFDIVYCMFMAIFYFFATILTAVHINFVWRNFFLASEVSGIFTMAVYFYDSWHNCIFRLSSANAHEVH